MKAPAQSLELGIDSSDDGGINSIIHRPLLLGTKLVSPVGVLQVSISPARRCHLSSDPFGEQQRWGYCYVSYWWGSSTPRDDTEINRLGKEMAHKDSKKTNATARTAVVMIVGVSLDFKTLKIDGEAK